MSTLTKEWLLKTIAELEEERDAVPGVVNEDAANALAAMKLALASLEAESKPRQPELSHVIYHFRDWNEGFPIERFKADYVISWMLANYPPAQPTAVSVPDLKPVGFLFVSDDGAVAYSPADWPMKGFNLIGQIYGDLNACRAAMLQGDDGNSPAHSGCRPAQNCISPAQCGNSPAIPDGWVMVPEEPTHEMLEAGDEQFGTYDVYRRMIAASPQQK